MDAVRKNVENGVFEFEIDLESVPHFVSISFMGLPQVNEGEPIDMTEYGRELADYFKLKGFDVTLNQQTQTFLRPSKNELKFKL